MKKALLLLSIIFGAFFYGGQIKADYFENFDSYSTGSIETLTSGKWTPSATSGTVIITDLNADSNPNSIKFTSTCGASNCSAILWNLSTSTASTLSFSYYVSASSSFEIQQVPNNLSWLKINGLNVSIQGTSTFETLTDNTWVTFFGQ